jgi:hypothetical protein
MEYAVGISTYIKRFSLIDAKLVAWRSEGEVEHQVAQQDDTLVLATDLRQRKHLKAR